MQAHTHPSLCIPLAVHSSKIPNSVRKIKEVCDKRQTFVYQNTLAGKLLMSRNPVKEGNFFPIISNTL
jgi:hypothetical protein